MTFNQLHKDDFQDLWRQETYYRKDDIRRNYVKFQSSSCMAAFFIFRFFFSWVLRALSSFVWFCLFHLFWLIFAIFFLVGRRNNYFSSVTFLNNNLVVWVIYQIWAIALKYIKQNIYFIAWCIFNKSKKNIYIYILTHVCSNKNCPLTHQHDSCAEDTQYLLNLQYLFWKKYL